MLPERSRLVGAVVDAFAVGNRRHAAAVIFEGHDELRRLRTLVRVRLLAAPHVHRFVGVEDEDISRVHRRAAQAHLHARGERRSASMGTPRAALWLRRLPGRAGPSSGSRSPPPPPPPAATIRPTISTISPSPAHLSEEDLRAAPLDLEERALAPLFLDVVEARLDPLRPREERCAQIRYAWARARAVRSGQLAARITMLRAREAPR